MSTFFKWRVSRDSNPGYPFGVYSLSRGALSTTQPLTRELNSVELRLEKTYTDVFVNTRIQKIIFFLIEHMLFTLTIQSMNNCCNLFVSPLFSFLAIACLNMTACSPPPQEVPVVEKKMDRLVARVASINKEAGYALIQRYGRLNVTDENILYTVSVDGKTSNLKVTGERLGQFIAADIVSGDLNIGDAVYLRIIKEHPFIDNNNQLNNQ